MQFLVSLLAKLKVADVKLYVTQLTIELIDLKTIKTKIWNGQI